VFRVAGAVPDGWTLRGEGAAGGLAFVAVTEEFPSGRPAVRVRCAVRAADRAVVDLEDAPEQSDNLTDQQMRRPPGER
jgi:hypothetical protein